MGIILIYEGVLHLQLCCYNPPVDPTAVRPEIMLKILMGSVLYGEYVPNPTSRKETRGSTAGKKTNNTSHLPLVWWYLSRDWGTFLLFMPIIGHSAWPIRAATNRQIRCEERSRRGLCGICSLYSSLCIKTIPTHPSVWLV